MYAERKLTLKQFIYKEMKKYHIAEASYKNIRDKINYMMKNVPKFKRLKPQWDTAIQGQDRFSAKELPISFWNHFSEDKDFQAYLKQKVNPDYIQALKNIDYKLNGSDIAEILNQEEKGFRPFTDMVTKTDLLYVMVCALFAKEFPNLEINKDLLNFDLNILNDKTDPHKKLKLKYNDEDLELAHMHALNPAKYYLKPKNNTNKKIKAKTKADNPRNKE